MVANSLPKKLPPGIKLDTQPEALQRYAASHRGPCALPLGIARPNTPEQIEQLVVWARQNEVALVTVSSRADKRSRADTALVKPALVVDLSQMRRMIHADTKDEIAVIEPSLDFAELDAALVSSGLRSIKPFFPRQGKSVLATYLEREPPIGSNTHWDTTDPLAALSIVFGSGESFRTGGASIPGTLEENLQRGNRQMMASGPLVTDYGRVILGSQGTLGLVSWASIYCESIPAIEEPRFYGSNELGVLTELARLLSLHQLGAHFFILSAAQLSLAMAEKGGDFEQVLKCEQNVFEWYLYVNLTANDYLPEQRMEWQIELLSDLASRAKATLVEAIGTILPAAFARRLQSPPEKHYKDTAGESYAEAICLTQLDKCQALVSVVHNLVNDFASSARRSILIATYIQPTIQGVSCHLEFTMFSEPEDNALLVTLERLVVSALAENGGFLSRPYGEWAKIAYERDANIVPYLRKVKDLFDPSGILNPGKLCF